MTRHYIRFGLAYLLSESDEALRLAFKNRDPDVMRTWLREQLAAGHECLRADGRLMKWDEKDEATA